MINLQLDSYWTYEICHGKHVKQYHEERETKIIITQEFYLGRWDKLKAEEISKMFQFVFIANDLFCKLKNNINTVFYPTQYLTSRIIVFEILYY